MLPRSRGWKLLRIGRLLMAGAVAFSSAEPVSAATIPAIRLSKRTVRVVSTHEDDAFCPRSNPSSGISRNSGNDGNSVGGRKGSPALRLDLSHNSFNTAPSVWGRGWGTDLDQRLELDAVGNAVWVDGHGSKRKFFRVSTSTPPVYSTPVNTFMALSAVEIGPGGEILALKRREKIGTEVAYRVAETTSVLRSESLVDRNGNALTFIRDGQGRLIGVQDVHGRTLTINYDPAGFVGSVSDFAGRTVTFSYDGQGRRVSETGAEGTVGYAYDAADRITQTTFPNGGVRTIAYDAQGRVLTEEDDGGQNRRSYEYFPSSTVVTDSLSRVTAFHYINRSGLRKISKIVDPAGQEAIFEYDSQMNMTRQVDVLGRETRTEYDGSGNITRIVDPSGGQTTMSYSADFSRATSLIDQRGNPLTMNYDASGNLNSFQDAMANSASLTYDAQGHVASARDALNNLTSFSYDPVNGALTAMTDPLNRTTQLQRDSLSRVTRKIDAKGKATDYEYDASENLTKVTDANLGVTQYFYVDGRGGRLLSSVTDAENHTTLFSHDLLGRQTGMTNPLSQTRTWAHDSEGNLTQITTPKTDTIVHEYDSLNRRVKTTTADGTVTINHDNAGRVTQMVHHNGSQIATSYDALDRPTQVTQILSNGFSATIGYQYDAVGNRTAMTTPWGTFQYSFDALNRLQTLTTPSGKVFTYTYDALKRRTKLGFPNSTESNWVYDAASQILQVTHVRSSDSTVLLARDYTYDLAGNRGTMVDARGTHSYQYDDLHRLTQAAHPAGAAQAVQVETFSYDKVGNRISDAVSGTHVYDAANRLQEDDDFTFTFDANGNRVSRQAKAGGPATGYQYDVEDRLVRVDLPNGEALQYKYDALGRRIEVSSGTIANPEVRRFIYDGEDVLAVLDAQNQLVSLYTHGPGIDDPHHVVSSGQDFYLYVDALGSVIAVSDDQGQIIEEVEYSAYGVATFVRDPSGSATQHGRSGTPNAFWFTAREFDPESGLYLMRTRFYDPGKGVFLTTDTPLLNSRDFNHYAALRGNPIRYSDPWGEDVILVKPPGFPHWQVFIGNQKNSYTLYEFAPPGRLKGGLSIIPFLPVEGEPMRRTGKSEPPPVTQLKRLKLSPEQDLLAVQRADEYILQERWKRYVFLTNDCRHFARGLFEELSTVGEE